MQRGWAQLAIRLGCAALVAAIAWADYATRYEFEFFAFYSLPVALAAWFGTRRAALALACASSACWLLSTRLAAQAHSHDVYLYWETALRFVSYLVTALTFAKLRSDLREREDVLHVVSHDLRAPLNVLAGHAGLLKRTLPAGGPAARSADAVLRAACHLDAMVEDLLDSARGKARQLRLAMRPVDLAAFLTELLGRSAQALEVERVRLELPAAGGPTALVDPDRLERVVVNLLTNALKFSPPGSPVLLRAAARGGRATLSVADRGPGISHEDLPHVFDRFYRGRGTATRRGLGLGLFSVKLLVAAQGGTVRVEPGGGDEGGATFHVEFAAAKARAQERR